MSKIDRFENLRLKIDRFGQTSQTCAKDATGPINLVWLLQAVSKIICSLDAYTPTKSTSKNLLVNELSKVQYVSETWSVMNNHPN